MNETKWTLIAAVAMASVAAGGVTLAADTITEQVATQTAEPVASQAENPVFEYSARKVLGFVSEARVAIGNNQRDTAIAYLDEALRELESIRNMRDYMEMMGIRFGRVLYGEAGSYYIPIADDTYAVRTYARGPFWSGDKGTAVRDVELITVDIKINPETASGRLAMAKQELQAGDFGGADRELKAFLDESIHETASLGQPFTRLQDNIYLTRILIRQENYDGARYTLKHAKRALDDFEKTVITPERQASASALRQEIDSLDATIKQRDPGALRKASEQVDRWWEDLKAWTRDKTS